jgi:adenosine deaminase
MDLNALPKVELHLHLDCSLSYSVARRIQPDLTFEAYRESFIAPAKCTDLADYISRAVKGFELMQTPEHLRLVTLDLFEQLERDRVIYAEIRFAPLLHTARGLSPAEVVQAVMDATGEGIRTYGIEARLILCTLRHFDEPQSLETIGLCERFRDTLVAGFDIAADEAGFPIDAHKAAFAYAHKVGIPCTAHAGEAKGAESMWETIRHFRPRRIGHGVRCIEDPALLHYIRDHNLHLEVCPTSNIQVNVFDTLAKHPADYLYRNGISMSINTDTRTISDTDLTREYGLLKQAFGWDLGHFRKCNLEAIAHAFAPDEVKDKVRKRLLDAYPLPAG